MSHCGNPSKRDKQLKKTHRELELGYWVLNEFRATSPRILSPPPPLWSSDTQLLGILTPSFGSFWQVCCLCGITLSRRHGKAGKQYIGTRKGQQGPWLPPLGYQLRLVHMDAQDVLPL